MLCAFHIVLNLHYLCMGYKTHVFCSYLSRDWSKCKHRLLSLFKLIVEGIQEKRQKTDGESTCTRDKVFIVTTAIIRIVHTIQSNVYNFL